MVEPLQKEVEELRNAQEGMQAQIRALRAEVDENQIEMAALIRRGPSKDTITANYLAMQVVHLSRRSTTTIFIHRRRCAAAAQ